MEDNKVNCRNCFYWQYDTDDEYCAHPNAMVKSAFGLSLNAARKLEEVCGPSGKSYKQTEVRKLI